MVTVVSQRLGSMANHLSLLATLKLYEAIYIYIYVGKKFIIKKVLV